MTSRTRANASRKKTLSLPANVLLGIQSLVDGNERIIGYMLGSENSENLVDELVDCMRVNNLSAEMLLARFFDGKILSEYRILSQNSLEIMKCRKNQSHFLSVPLALIF